MLKELRERMIEEVDWCRKHINKQVSRLTRMFKWAVANELIGPTVYQALTTVAGLKRGRTEARETGPVLPVDDAGGVRYTSLEALMRFMTTSTADLLEHRRKQEVARELAKRGLTDPRQPASRLPGRPEDERTTRPFGRPSSPMQGPARRKSE